MTNFRKAPKTVAVLKGGADDLVELFVRDLFEAIPLLHVVVDPLDH
jgi:hypothetical protein